MTMMSDGLKDIGDQKPVKDISEIMLENLEDGDAEQTNVEQIVEES